MSNVIAVCVLAMLGKLYRETAVRRLVFARHVAFDDVASVQAKCLGARDGDRIEKFVDVLFDHMLQAESRTPNSEARKEPKIRRRTNLILPRCTGR
jgi:hypothetical protein